MIHPIDLVGAGLLSLDRRRLTVFPRGWGDRDRLRLLAEVPAPSDPVDEIDIVWSWKEEHRGFRVRQGRFSSPIRHLLPAEIGSVPVELVEPGSGSDRVCVMLPAWNDHGFVARRRLALLLARRRIATVCFEIPLYGERRVVPSPGQAIPTVADFATMGYGAVREGRALVSRFAGSHAVGVSGYSMGGNLAALISTTVRRPVAVAPLAAAHSPGPVYLDGVLRRAIAWRALGGRDSREELRAVLDSVSVLVRPPLPHHRSAVIVAASRDGFVPPPAVAALAAHWHGSDLRWVDSGHATLLWQRRELLADAIRDSFDRVRQAPVGSGG